MNPVVRSDIVVSDFLDSVGGYRHKERRDQLLDLLDIDLDWHMHNISDGERRRVQLCMGLMAPWDVLLLDEVRTLFQMPKSFSEQQSNRSQSTSTSSSATNYLLFSKKIANRGEPLYYVKYLFNHPLI
jgi:ABC-type molybdenum transport system ATPase subunit/photorepair protein PhrA